MNTNRSVVEQLLRRITELVKADISEKAMREFIVEEVKRKFSEFVRRLPEVEQ